MPAVAHEANPNMPQQTSQPFMVEEPAAHPEAEQQVTTQPEPTQGEQELDIEQWLAMGIPEYSPEEVEEMARALNEDIDAGKYPQGQETPVEQGADPVPQEAVIPEAEEVTLEELMACQEAVNAHAVQQGWAPAQEQLFAQAPRQGLDIDPMAWLNDPMGWVMEPQDNTAAQGFQNNAINFDENDLGGNELNGNYLSQQHGAQDNQANVDQANMSQAADIGNTNMSFTDEQAQMADQNLQASIMAGEEHDQMAEFLNIPVPEEVNYAAPDEGNAEMDDSDLFADGYVENHASQGVDSQVTTGTKRQRADDDQEEERPAQRARLE